MPARYSVVVPVYNNAELVGEAIASILGQTLGDLELIVVDDGSTDETVAAVREHSSDPRLKLIQQANAGPSAARNAGIAAADAPFVAFLDSDDLWMPDYLAKVDAALAARPDAGFAYVDAWRIDTEGRVFVASAMERQDPPADPPREPTDFLRLLIERGNFIFVSTTVRKAALDRVGGFDPSLHYVEDFDLWIRILEAGFGAVHSGERLAIKRDRPGSLSGAELEMATSMREVLTKVADHEGNPTAVRETARARAAEVGRTVEGIDRTGPRRTVARLVRGAASTARRRTFPGQVWHREVPAEIASAFPQLVDRAAGT